MFKKFSQKEHFSGLNPAKSSVQRGIRTALIEQFPLLAGTIDEIIPKKTPLMIARCQNYITLIVVNNTPLFFNFRDGPYMPTLRLLHKYPAILPHMQCDKGAIKYVVGGAHVMCPGLTSKGGCMPDNVPAGVVVAVHAEGKQHAMGVGMTKMSSQQIRELNKDIAIEIYHHLTDGLWKMQQLE